MDKKIISTKLPFNFDWCDMLPIADIEADIKQLKFIGATHIEIIDEGEGDIQFIAYNKRIETDEEFHLRKKIELEKNLELEKQELAELDRLKRKYENKY